MRLKFITTVMVPVVHTIDAVSIADAKNKVDKMYQIDRKVSCEKGSTQPFIHSMKVVAGEYEEPEIA